MAQLQPMSPVVPGTMAARGPITIDQAMLSGSNPLAERSNQMATMMTQPIMPTAAARQAEINARLGTTGPQYGGAGLGAVNPVVPAGYTQVGNRLLSPSVMAAQAEQQASGPRTADGRLFNPNPPDFGTYSPEQLAQLANQQRSIYVDKMGGDEFAKRNQLALDQQYTPEKARQRAEMNIRQGLDPTGALTAVGKDIQRQNVTNNMFKTGQPYTGAGTWSADGQRYMPTKTEIGIGTMGRAGYGNLLDTNARAWGNEFGIMDKLENAAKQYQVTPDILKKLTNNPEMAEKFYTGGKSISPTFNTKVQAYNDAQRKAYEAYMAQVNAANARKNSGGGFWGGAGSLGGFVNAVNPFKGVTKIIEGKGGPMDYLNLAKTAYGFI